MFGILLKNLNVVLIAEYNGLVSVSVVFANAFNHTR